MESSSSTYFPKGRSRHKHGILCEGLRCHPETRDFPLPIVEKRELKKKKYHNQMSLSLLPSVRKRLAAEMDHVMAHVNQGKSIHTPRVSEAGGNTPGSFITTFRCSPQKPFESKLGSRVISVGERVWKGPHMASLSPSPDIPPIPTRRLRVDAY